MSTAHHARVVPVGRRRPSFTLPASSQRRQAAVHSLSGEIQLKSWTPSSDGARREKNSNVCTTLSVEDDVNANLTGTPRVSSSPRLRLTFVVEAWLPTHAYSCVYNRGNVFWGPWCFFCFVFFEGGVGVKRRASLFIWLVIKKYSLAFRTPFCGLNFFPS